VADRVAGAGEAAGIAVSLIGSSVIDGLLKSWIARPRPELVPHLVQVTNASFPSGHAMISSAVYLTLAPIGMSRVYLGVHWPSDVLAGWCFGTAWALMVWMADRWVGRRSRRLRGGSLQT
jgi:undecaprenyl-diphosphatase